MAYTGTQRAVTAERALQIAAEDFYQSEVVDTEMEELMIGQGQDYANKQEWLEAKIEEWMDAAHNAKGLRR